MLLTIGIPGSGKSYAIRRALEKGWVGISSDELRVNRLEQLAANGETIEIDGEAVIPDSSNPAHVFHSCLREWVNQEIFRQIEINTESKKNIVLDITNVSLHRVLFMNKARQHGYFVEAFVFEPNSDIFVHVENIEKRVAQGGLDISGGRDNLRQSRLAVIRSVKNAFHCFSGSMKQDRYYFKSDGPLDIDFEWRKMKSTPNDYQVFLSQLDEEEREAVQQLAARDIFNEIHRLPVKHYGR
tara:strand:- start:237 stop:959 length:723 start_codon:yes stop_codon:yes gene_type:complete